MFTAIFNAEIKLLDQEYTQTAAMLRNLAVERYGCLNFVSLTEGDNEIALSYWESPVTR